MRTGIANFTLDHGRCPRWLFERMVKLGRSMSEVIIGQYGPDEFIRRMSDPVWFQSLGTVLAFDWNASGLTTVLTGALKAAISGQEKDLGVFICGGKGKISLKTPEQIRNWSERIGIPQRFSNNLVYNSKMTAKVDSALMQDGFELYHHIFMFSRRGAWTVIQQGMNKQNKTARRYHWFSDSISNLVCEPHAGIATQLLQKNVLNLTAKKGERNRQLSTELVSGNGFNSLIKDVSLLQKYYTPLSQMARFKKNSRQLTLLNLENKEFKTHPVISENFAKSRYLQKILYQLCSRQPKNYEELLATPGVGGKTMRALALVAEILYGAKLSYSDPARYSFAHGGKDQTPYPVDCKTYDQTISTMRELVNKSNMNIIKKNKIFKKLQLKKRNKS